MKMKVKMFCTFEIETNEDDVYRALAKQQLVQREIIDRLDEHVADHMGGTRRRYETDLGPATVEIVNFDDSETDILWG